MGRMDLRTGYAQLELLVALFVLCGFLAVVVPLLAERLVKRGY